MPSNLLAPIHPGEILLEEFMTPIGLSINGLARELHVAPNRISRIVNGNRSISAVTALRLAAFFGTSAESWMNLQANFDLALARRSDSGKIKQEVRRMVKAPKPALV